MKSIFLVYLLAFSSVAFTQDKNCNLWLGNVSDSANSIKQFAEGHLEIQTKLVPADNSNIQEMKDDNELAQIKVWLKPKKVLSNGAMTTVNTISSFKIVSLSDKIDEIYAALVDKVKSCTTESSATTTVFGKSKMVIERHSGGFGKKSLPMSTLTVTAN